MSETPCGARWSGRGDLVCDRERGHRGQHRGYNAQIDEPMFWVSADPAGGAQAPQPPPLDELEEAIDVAQRHLWHDSSDHLNCVPVIIDQLKELKAQRPYRVAAPPPHPAPQCPHGENCACAISTRHEWFVAFCEERDKAAYPAPPQEPT